MTSRRLKGRAKRPAAITLPQPDWDKGADGPANRAGLRRVEITEIDPKTGRERPTGQRHMRRVSNLDRWHDAGKITAAGYIAATALRDAFEATFRTPSSDPGQPRVDSSPKPDHAVTIQIDRLSRFHNLSRLVEATDRELVENCVLFDRSPAALRQYRGRLYARGLEHLRDALDRLAASYTKAIRTAR